jgi:predicted metal-dependent hydrolase
MSIKPHQITVQGMDIDVVRKNIKNLHLAVYPPNGRVRVAAPLRIDDEAVRLAVIARIPWIKRQQAKFEGQVRQSAREYVSGESHYFQGNRYLLNVNYHNAPPKVGIRNNTHLDLYVRRDSDTAQRERTLTEWYRRELKAMIPPLIEKWQPIMGVQVAEWGVKQMKTKWGTCNIQARRIWLNLELVKKSPYCLEYVVVHEMVHLLERYHNDRFKALMTQFLPHWHYLRDALNHDPLGYADWEY